MRIDTPLAEVVALLPTEAARQLDREVPAVQKSVLERLRAAFVYWEGCSLDLNPVQIEAVVNSLVILEIGSQKIILELMAALGKLASDA